MNKVNIPQSGPLYDYNQQDNTRTTDKIMPQQQPVLPLLNHNNRKRDNNSLKWDDDDFANILGFVCSITFSRILNPHEKCSFIDAVQPDNICRCASSPIG